MKITRNQLKRLIIQEVRQINEGMPGGRADVKRDGIEKVVSDLYAHIDQLYGQIDMLRADLKRMQ